MATFRLDGDLLRIGEGAVEVRTLVEWLANTGTLIEYGYVHEDVVEDDLTEARVRGAEDAADEWSGKVDSAIEELTYLDHDADPYRYHDDNRHPGAVAYCPDAFCATAGRTDTVIDILKGA